jgi:hypothetical protein
MPAVVGGLRGGRKPDGMHERIWRNLITKSPGFVNYTMSSRYWSAPFGLMLLEHVILKTGVKILDVALAPAV